MPLAVAALCTFVPRAKKWFLSSETRNLCCDAEFLDGASLGKRIGFKKMVGADHLGRA